MTVSVKDSFSMLIPLGDLFCHLMGFAESHFGVLRAREVMPITLRLPPVFGLGRPCDNVPYLVLDNLRIFLTTPFVIFCIGHVNLVLAFGINYLVMLNALFCFSLMLHGLNLFKSMYRKYTFKSPLLHFGGPVARLWAVFIVNGISRMIGSKIFLLTPLFIRSL